MELSSSDKERIQHQYDALAKKTLVGEAKSHRRTLAKRAAREVTFSDLSESELAQLFTTDEYESDYFRFQVSGFDVLVKNELLAEALNALPEKVEIENDTIKSKRGDHHGIGLLRAYTQAEYDNVDLLSTLDTKI